MFSQTAVMVRYQVAGPRTRCSTPVRTFPSPDTHGNVVPRLKIDDGLGTQFKIVISTRQHEQHVQNGGTPAGRSLLTDLPNLSRSIVLANFHESGVPRRWRIECRNRHSTAAGGEVAPVIRSRRLPVARYVRVPPCHPKPPLFGRARARGLSRTAICFTAARGHPRASISPCVARYLEPSHANGVGRSGQAR